MTIYNESLALVKDARKIHLDQGESALAWRDVSARIRPETALLRNVDHPKTLSLIEQNFDFDLLTPQKLLEKYVGHKVTVIKTNPATGAETREEATVLATNSGVVLRFADRIETGVPGRLAFASVPENLRRGHERNAEVLERIYIGRRFKNDTERLEKLFELYTKMTAAKVEPARKAIRGS